MSVCEDQSTRAQLIAWLNATFDSKVSRCDQLASGTVYCHALQRLRPDLLYLKRTVLAPKSESEAAHNFRLVQLTLEKFGCSRRLPIDRLAKGSWPEHHELLLQMQKACSAQGKPARRSQSTASTKSSSRSSTPTPLPPDVNCIRQVHVNLVRERDFYFHKLSKVEAFLQTAGNEQQSLAQALLELIYSSEDYEENATEPSRLPRKQLG